MDDRSGRNGGVTTTMLPPSEVRVAPSRVGRVQVSACRQSFGGDSEESEGEGGVELGRPLRPW